MSEPDRSPAAVREQLAGVITIAATPLAPGGTVDWDAHAALVTRAAAAGGVVTVNGNTGEFYALSPQETARAVRSAVAAAAGRVLVMGSVGLDTASAVAAARDAVAAGAGCVMVHQPVHPYQSAAGWADYHEQIAGAIPGTPVVLYVRDPRITGADIAGLAGRCPNIAGVKYSVPDPVRFACVARDGGLERLAWICGLAELYAPAFWALGACGFTSGLANVAPALAAGLAAALAAGERGRAMAAWESARTFEQLRAADSSADNVSVVKEALAQLGLAGRAVRPPSRELPAARREQVAAVIASWKEEGWL